MTDYKEIIKSFTKEDYSRNLVNLHIHTVFSDGLAEAENIVKQAKEKGYKKIAVCDHNTVEAYLKTDILKEDIVIPAVEFDVWCGYVFMHLLGYGIDVNNEDLKPFFAKTKKETEADIVRIFSTRNIKKLISYGLDGLEVYYPYQRHRGIIKFRTARHIEKLADKYNLIKTGGTDLHTRNL